MKVGDLNQLSSCVRNYLDLSPSAQLNFVNELKPKLNDEAKEAQLTELHSRLKYELNFEAEDKTLDSYCLKELQDLTKSTCTSFVDFLESILTNLGNLKTLQPITKDELQEILTMDRTQATLALLERIGGDRFKTHESIEPKHLPTLTNIAYLLLPYARIKLTEARPRSIEDIKSNEQHIVYPKDSEVEFLIKALIRGVEDEYRYSEICEHDHPSLGFESDVLPSQVSLIYQLVSNFDDDDKTGFTIDTRNLGSYKTTGAAGDELFRHQDTGQTISLHRHFSMNLDLAAVTVILNRIRKANLASIYADNRFFLNKRPNY